MTRSSTATSSTSPSTATALVPGRGARRPEPATGNILGRIGGAAPEDVHDAGATAAVAQRRLGPHCPHPERAAVMHRAADLWEKHAAEIMDWNTREVGAIGPMAGFAVHVAAAECREAGALPSVPRGELLASEKPSPGLRVPRAGGRGRGRLAVQRADHPGHPRGRAGPGAGQCRDPRARSAAPLSPVVSPWCASSTEAGTAGRAAAVCCRRRGPRRGDGDRR